MEKFVFIYAYPAYILYDKRKIIFWTKTVFPINDWGSSFLALKNEKCDFWYNLFLLCNTPAKNIKLYFLLKVFFLPDTARQNVFLYFLTISFFTTVYLGSFNRCYFNSYEWCFSIYLFHLVISHKVLVV